LIVLGDTLQLLKDPLGLTFKSAFNYLLEEVLEFLPFRLPPLLALQLLKLFVVRYSSFSFHFFSDGLYRTQRYSHRIVNSNSLANVELDLLS
jgi:hypothetical protein